MKGLCMARTRDNSRLTKEQLRLAIELIFEEIGGKAESYAKTIITEAKRVDTGRMRNSVDGSNYDIDEKKLYIGSNIKYAIYHELGSGRYASNGQGRTKPWKYKDGHGKWHITYGVSPLHFLQRSLTEHADEYKTIVEYYLGK